MSAYTSSEVKARSADGTMVPLSLVYRKGLALDGSHPAYLEGYGAYGITIEPVVQHDARRLAGARRRLCRLPRRAAADGTAKLGTAPA